MSAPEVDLQVVIDDLNQGAKDLDRRYNRLARRGDEPARRLLIAHMTELIALYEAAIKRLEDDR